MSKRAGDHLEKGQPRQSSIKSAAVGQSSTSTNDDGEGEFTTVPTREEKRKFRKMSKQKPQFQYDISYFRQGKKVGIAHIRDLLLYIVADAQRPSWIVPEHKSNISRTVVLLVPGLLPGHLGLPPIPIAACLPFTTVPPESVSPIRVDVPVINQLFTYACPTRAPGDQRKLHSVTGTLLSCPLQDSVRRKKEAEQRRLAAIAKNDSSSPLVYLLTPNQMLDNDYNLPSYVSPSDRRFIPGLDPKSINPELAELLYHSEYGAEFTAVPESYTMSRPGNSKGDSSKKPGATDEWVETPKATGPPEGGLYPILAMDCEMVVTEDGQVLARISVIDFHSGVNVYDKLVKPPKPVIDYRTQWSGITEKKLDEATLTLTDIQAALVSGPNPLITPNTILLGHSLECDLNVLRIRHPLCIDTAVIFKHPRGPPYKPGLKWLVQRWTGKEIQTNKDGHDSEEDARACVDLLRLKMANGADFGTFADTSESIFERMNRFVTDPVTKQTRTTAFCDVGNARAGHGGKATTVSQCSSDEEVVDEMVRHAQNHDFVFGRLTELAAVQGWNSKTKSDEDDEEEREEALSSALAAFNDRIKKLHDSLPNNAAFIVLTGHSNPLPMLSLAARRQTWERLVKTVESFEDIPKEERWLSEHDRRLEEATAEAREGMAFFCVKRT